jgi:hypothetical protein
VSRTAAGLIHTRLPRSEGDGMDASKSPPLTGIESSRSPAYEPLCIERELTPAELEREILYAGQADISDPA